MSEIKHTPGKWWASGLEVGTAPMMDVKIARVSGANFDEAKANARLIAAAPELLEALKATNSAAHEALIVLRDVLRDDARFDDLIRALDNATDVGYAAIAKAEGQS
jgi:hypothetical protein